MNLEKVEFFVEVIRSDLKEYMAIDTTSKNQSEKRYGKPNHQKIFIVLTFIIMLQAYMYGYTCISMVAIIIIKIVFTL